MCPACRTPGRTIARLVCARLPARRPCRAYARAFHDAQHPTADIRMVASEYVRYYLLCVPLSTGGRRDVSNVFTGEHASRDRDPNFR